MTGVAGAAGKVDDGAMVIGRGWLRRRTADSAARILYDAAVAQSRRPVFYADLGVPDSLDGRFDLLVLHAFLVLRRLKAEASPAAAAVAQEFYDVLFADMDESLRELGVGDLSVGKKIRAMTEAFRGRIEAYDAAVADAAPGPLQEALRRNLYGTTAANPEQLARVAAYVREAAAAVQGQDLATILQGRIDFGAAPEALP